MTLSTTVNKVSYAGDGTTAAFAIPFLFLENGHVAAILRDAAGIETAWALNTQFTLTGAGAAAGGTLDVAVSPTDYTPAIGETLVIRRVVPETQETDYPEGGAFPASAHEQALDKLTMLVQQHSEEIARTPALPVSSPLSDILIPEPGASEVIRWNAEGAALETVPIGNLSLDIGATVSSPATGDRLVYTGAIWTNRSDSVLSIRDFGAVGDGVTDDAAAIQAALAAAAGRALLFPKSASPYLIGATLNVPSNISLVSDGAVLKASGGTFAIFTLDTVTDIAVRGLAIDGDYPARAAGEGFNTTDCARVVVESCVLQNIPGTAVSITRGEDFRITGNRIDTIGLSGVRWNAAGAGNFNRYLRVDNNRMTGIDQTITAGHAAVMAASGDGANEFLWVRNNYLGSDHIGIGLDRIADAWVDGNRIVGAGSSGEGIAFTGGRVQIGRNTISNFGSAGILWFLDQSGGQILEDVLIEGNICSDNFAQGIRFTFVQNSLTAHRARVVGNICYNTGSGPTQTNGFQVTVNEGVASPNFDNIEVSFNQVSDNDGAGISIPTMSGLRQGVWCHDNFETDDTPVTRPIPYLQQGEITCAVGAAGVEDDQVMLAAHHRAGEANSSGASGFIGTFFGEFNKTKYSGIKSAKIGTFANVVRLSGVVWGNGQEQEVWRAQASSGGVRDFILPGSTWNDNRLVLGSNHLWVDATGNLRIKNSAPSSDTDGAVVGTQS